MPITEETRRQLHDTVAQHLGPDAAAQLMEVTIPANTELATRADLDLLRAELRAEMAVLRGEMGELRGEVRGEMAELRAELAEHREATTTAISKVSKALDKLRAELYRSFLPLVALVVAVMSYLTR